MAWVPWPAALAPYAGDAPLSSGEVRYAVRNEMARTLIDVLERRSRVALFATAVAATVAPQVAATMAEALGWDSTRRDTELAAFARAAELRLAWRDPHECAA